MLMKRNLSVVACLLVSGLCSASGDFPSVPEEALPGNSPDYGNASKEQWLFAPVHPRLSLDSVSGTLPYPYVNVTLGGDLCGMDGFESSSHRVQRRSHYLSAELAADHESPPGEQEAGIRAWLLLLLLPCLLQIGGSRPRSSA